METPSLWRQLSCSSIAAFPALQINCTSFPKPTGSFKPQNVPESFYPALLLGLEDKGWARVLLSSWLITQGESPSGLMTTSSLFSHGDTPTVESTA